MLVAFTPLSFFDLLAHDARRTAVQGAARLLRAGWFSVCNGIAGRKCHIDGLIVLSLLRVLAHGQVLLDVINNPGHKFRFRHLIRIRTFAATFSLR
jgi:hypothetical protein